MKKGQKMSDKQKKLIGIANSGKNNGMFGKISWNTGTKGIQISGMKGKKMSEESRNKMRLAKLGKPRAGNPIKWKHSPETKQKISVSGKNIHRGANNARWKGGITPINTQIRNSEEYKDWRTAVFKRDDYTCVECKSRGYKLQADHIKPFAYYPELRLVIENGRTLCVPCHRKTDTYGNRGKLKVIVAGTQS